MGPLDLSNNSNILDLSKPGGYILGVPITGTSVGRDYSLVYNPVTSSFEIVPTRGSEIGLRRKPIFMSDFINVTSPFRDFVGTAVSSGTVSSNPAGSHTTANHPGTANISSSTTTNSGYYIGSNTGQLLIAGSEIYNAIFKVEVTANTTVRLGLTNSNTSSDATNGAYIEISGTTVSGKTATNSVRSTTASTYTLTQSTWYRAKIEVNSDATLVTFTLYNDAGDVLWTDTLGTNIPTATGRETGTGFIATNSGTSAQLIAVLDYMSLEINRTLTRGGI